MTLEPANEVELNAAAWECADAGVAMYQAEAAHQALLRRIHGSDRFDVEELLHVVDDVAVQKLRHRAATAWWAQIRPAEPARTETTPLRPQTTTSMPTSSPPSAGHRHRPQPPSRPTCSPNSSTNGSTTKPPSTSTPANSPTPPN